MELKTILQRIDNLKIELDEFRPLDATQEAQILQKFRLDWNYHSSKIEGNTLTYGETKALLLFGITAQGKPLRHHFEITGHNEAIKWVMDVVANKEPFTENLIRQLHTILLKERYQVDAVTADGKPTRRWIEVGQYKSAPNHVKTITDEIFYFATPEETPSKMHDLINWFRGEMENKEINALVLAAEFHYRFIRIHPFDDGNGRVARLLMNFIFLMKGLPPVVIKIEDKQNYFAALRQADAGVLNGFIEYIGTNLIHSLELMIKAAKGESIEELDDIDKEIALFVKGLEAENVNSIKKSKTYVDNIIKHSLLPLYQLIANKLEQFNQLFMVDKKLFRINKIISQSSLKAHETAVNTMDEVISIEYFFIYEGFLKSQKDFSVNLIYKAIFRNNSYDIIESSKSKLSIKKIYTEQLTELEMTEIANQIAKSILEEIKSKIKLKS